MYGRTIYNSNFTQESKFITVQKCQISVPAMLLSEVKIRNKLNKQNQGSSSILQQNAIVAVNLLQRYLQYIQNIHFKSIHVIFYPIKQPYNHIKMSHTNCTSTNNNYYPTTSIETLCLSHNQHLIQLYNTT